MAEQRKLDESPVPGGAYRVGEKVVDAEGRDITEQHQSTVDKIDTEERDNAVKERERIEQEQATKAQGGLSAVLARAFGVRDPSLANMPVTEPRAASQEEKDPKAPVGVSAATLTGSPGPTPVAVRGVAASAPEPTESPADSMPSHEEIIKAQEERLEQEAQTREATAPAATRKKGGAKPVAGGAPSEVSITE